MPNAFSLLFALPGFVLCMLAFGAVDVAAGTEELVELRRLAEQGDADAQYNLGVMYDNGEGVPEDNAEAVKWYRMAAEQGHAGTQFMLGLMYAYGDGVPEDDAEAVKWYRMAAEQGHAGTQFMLGVMYNNGEGVPEDYVRAYAWYNLAAAQGNEPAVKAKDGLRERMTAKQIARAQELSNTLFHGVKEEADLQTD